MKKVRLFAVAAAMGMFAATVNAAAPKVTQEAYTATWGTSDTVVKVEFGGKVILPTADVKVMKQTLSTDKKFAPKKTGDYGVGELRSDECFEGFSSKVGKDTNEDGIVDYPLLAWGPQATTNNGGYSLVSTDWFYDSIKYFPTAKTSLYYFGMTSTGYGARFLAPNQEARDGVVVIEGLYDEDDTRINYHGWYENTDAGNQALVDMYKKAGKIVEVKDPKYGDVIGYKTTDLDLDKDGSGKSIDLTKETVKIELTSTAQRGKYALADLNEEFANWVAGVPVNTTLVAVSNSTNTESKYAAAGTIIDYKAAFSTDAAGAPLNTLTKGNIYEVKETRDGFEVVGLAPATMSDANDRPIVADSDAMMFVLNNGSRYGWEVYAKLKPALSKANEIVHEFKWSIADGGFNKVTVSSTSNVISGTFDAKEFFGGAYRVDTPANTTDKYVVDFGMGVYSFDLDGQVNASKGTMTFDYYSKTGVANPDKTVTTPAVKLGYTWYPAFNTEADLIDFVTKMSGLRKANSDWFAANEDNISGGSRTWANGVKEDYIPKNELDHYKAKQCAYATGEAVAVDASAYNVTADTSTVDVNKGGVYTAKQIIKVGDKEVATRDITVVVAPKYVREYKNGRVVSLKAYHLNGGLYSHTTFDYAKKTSTAVFYALDGVTAVETVTSAIK